MQVDDGLTHMLDEVFDERLENKSESSVLYEHPKPTTDRQKTGTSAENMDKRKRSELEDDS
ncbi:unnamed protein product, partial [Boreogadus saida]